MRALIRGSLRDVTSRICLSSGGASEVFKNDLCERGELDLLRIPLKYCTQIRDEQKRALSSSSGLNRGGQREGSKGESLKG